jgi:hypothetical protein
MRRVLPYLGLLVAFPLITGVMPVPGDWLTVFGIGPVRFGMTVAEAERALGTKLVSDDAQANEACRYATRADRKDPDLAFMIEDGKLVRIDAGDMEPGDPPARARSDRGFDVGADEAVIINAYGAVNVKVEQHPYNENGHLLIIDAPDHKRAIVYETDRGKVTSYRAGLYPAVTYSEGCS